MFPRLSWPWGVSEDDVGGEMRPLQGAAGWDCSPAAKADAVHLQSSQNPEPGVTSWVQLEPEWRGWGRGGVQLSVLIRSPLWPSDRGRCECPHQCVMCAWYRLMGQLWQQADGEWHVAGEL